MQNISNYQTFHRTAKSSMVDFYEMNFMKGIVLLVKVNEMGKILKSLLTNSFWSKDEGGSG